MYVYIRVCRRLAMGKCGWGGGGCVVAYLMGVKVVPCSCGEHWSKVIMCMYT